jgi:hypothetical protein
MPLASRNRAPQRTICDVWMRLAGELAVVADLSAQGSAAARRHDGPALASLIDRLRVAILGAISLHNTNHKDLDEEVKS